MGSMLASYSSKSTDALPSAAMRCGPRRSRAAAQRACECDGNARRTKSKSSPLEKPQKSLRRSGTALAASVSARYRCIVAIAKLRRGPLTIAVGSLT